ncbi:MAG: lysine--tRNA ligase, partial [Eggerthellaceae bacterium]|nr:lysine--tRNA ligase [Eggerthellaceae bacterium]
MDHHHNPEFTTMEAYQAFSDERGIAALTQGAIQAAALAACGTLRIEYLGQPIDLSGEWPRRTMLELASEGSGAQLRYDMPREEAATIAASLGVKVEPAWGVGKIVCEIFEATMEEKLIQPTFVTEHPVETSPLAKRNSVDGNVTDRFELLICGHEYANGFSELNDPVDQAQRFRAQVAAKETGDDEAMGYDDDYIRALEYGMPPAGGVGIGIDRLVMLLTDSESIRDVLLFPHMREEAK